MNVLRCYRRDLTIKRCFRLEPKYKPNSRFVKDLPFRKRLDIWWKSLGSNRLQELQDQLVELLFPSNLKENENVKRDSVKTEVDSNGNYINSVTFEVSNGPGFDTKHIVFLHGYGASLGCFARNFHIINSFKGLNHNYKVHFLDNISFGLSSNPKIASLNYWKTIPKMDYITLHDNQPSSKDNVHKKYYKLIDLFDVDVEKFNRTKSKLKPILKDMESYYVDALKNWKNNSGIDQIDFLVGHSFGGHWCASFALRHPEAVKNLVLLSPVGMERTAYAITAPSPSPEAPNGLKPSLGPNSYNFLSRFPLLSKSTIWRWYYFQPYLPRLLKIMGPFGVAKYYEMWYSKLFAVNKVIERLGGKTVFSSLNELKYGTNSECQLLVEYLYNSISNGTHSDTHIKYLLTPATTSRWPLFDKFSKAPKSVLEQFNMHVVYGRHDFMYSDAGKDLVQLLKEEHSLTNIHYHEVAEGGHNLYLQNPFGTNRLLKKIVISQDAH